MVQQQRAATVTQQVQVLQRNQHLSSVEPAERGVQ
jgi:hypothetical protein